MREIKFRAWDKENAEIVYGNNGLFMFVGTGTLGWQFADNWNVGVDDRFILMQYTGLKDKKGKEIYESDIVEINLGIKPATAIYTGELIPEHEVRYTKTVIWKDCGLTWEGSGSMLVKGNCNHFEIIGNIYENKELLK